MEFFSLKVSILISVVIGAAIRVFRMRSHATTTKGKILDGIFVAAVSVFSALILLPIIMSFFALPISYAAAIALLIALSAELVISKILMIINNADLLQIIKDYWSKRK